MTNEKVTPGMERIERIEKAWINLATFMPDDLEDFIDAEIELELLRVVRGMEAKIARLQEAGKSGGSIYMACSIRADELRMLANELRKSYGLEDTP